MNLLNKPFLFEEEDGSGQGGGGSEENQSDDGQSLKELSEQFGKLYKHVSKVSAEVGEVRKAQEAVNELQETINGFGEQFQAIQDRLPQNNDGEDVFDPYDKDQMVNTFNSMLEERLKPLSTRLESAITEDSFADLITQAQKNAALKTDFKLTDDELNTLTQEAAEKKVSARELGFEKYGERYFKPSKAKEMSNELKNNDTDPPPDTGYESHFEKLGIPTDPEEFMRLHREKGSDELKKMLMTKKE